MDISFLDRYSEVFIQNHSHATFNEIKQVSADAGHIVQDLARFWGENTIRLFEAILAVPRANRLIIRTEKFSEKIPEFAALAGVSEASLNTANHHLNKDRDLKYYRRLLGEKQLNEFCMPQENKVKAWLAMHKKDVELGD
jgi:hypothetical protein